MPQPWRYVIVLASFFVLMLQMGCLLTLGVYLVPLKEEFDSGAALSGWLASSSVAVMGLSSKGHFKLYQNNNVVHPILSIR